MTNTTPDIALARRERLLKFHRNYLAELAEAAPTWVDMAEDMHETVYSAEACELLAETAPDDSYMRGYWLGRAAALHAVAALTERTPESV